MKTATLISCLIIIAQLSFSQNIKKDQLAFQIKNENQNLKHWVSINNTNNKPSKPKTEQIKLVSKTRVIYISKFTEFDFENYLLEPKKEKIVLDEELENRIHGKTDYSTRNNN